MIADIKISIVIPTCNRKTSLLRLLSSLNQLDYASLEVIVVDSGEESVENKDLQAFNALNIQYIKSVKSVCIQRNMGIQRATSEWIFLCDDDLEVPADYLKKISLHICDHPEAGALTGIVLQKSNGAWSEQYPIESTFDLLFRFIFQSSIWGQVEISNENFLSRLIQRYYQKKGNHITKAGWPVITDFSGEYFKAPVYGLGASVVKKDWLCKSPYDEVLDPHGIGDNYGVAVGFPTKEIHILKHAFVHHHQASENRLNRAILYYRRILALHYFLKTKKELKHLNRLWFLWSLTGNLLLSIKNIGMLNANAKAMFQILIGRNPYVIGNKNKKKVIVPQL
jgi:glycosyltransferase involved in cell wall biosynthesis